MSHNAQVINGVEPDVLSQYANVAGRPLIAIGRGQTADYSTSGATSLAVNSYLRFYDTAPLNSITGATLNLGADATDWYDSVTLPAGLYFVRAYFGLLFSATGQAIFGLATGAIYIGARGIVGGAVNSSYDGGAFASALITLTTTSTIRLQLATVSNVAAIASQGNVPAEESWFLVEKLT